MYARTIVCSLHVYSSRNGTFARCVCSECCISLPSCSVYTLGAVPAELCARSRVLLQLNACVVILKPKV